MHQMGPVEVAKMCQNGIGDPSMTKLHPFFAKPAPIQANFHPSRSQNVDDAGSFIIDKGGAVAGNDEGIAAKSSRTDHSVAETIRESGVLTPGTFETPQSRNNTEPKKYQPSPLPQSDRQSTTFETPNRLQLPNPNEATTHQEAAAGAESELSAGNSTQQNVPVESPPHPKGAEPLAGKRVLKLNSKTGTLGSPPKPKKKDKKSLVVCIKYGHDGQSRQLLGEKIAQILDGTLQLPQTVPQPPSKRKRPKARGTAVDNQSSTKSTHPFFSGKPKDRSASQTPVAKPATKSPPRPKMSVFMSTPVSPRKPRNPFATGSASKLPQFGIKSLGTRVPGAKHPMWPKAGMSHVRGGDTTFRSPHCIKSADNGYKKSKGQVTVIGATESVLARELQRLDLERVRRSLPRNDDSFAPAPAELRIPQRHFESGFKVQHRIRPQLSINSPPALAGLDDSSQDELAGPMPAKAHPAISRLYLSLQHRLSAFDRSTCESLAWTHKYAPSTAAQVLQRGKDAIYIKEWLYAMKVQSVDTGASDSAAENVKSKSDTVPKKKRKKNKLDDFVVDSDDEGSDLDELSDNDDDGGILDVSQTRKSVMRPGNAASKTAGRLRNTIVISGPHGCGKTAAVYAIAKELDFEIFEINSSNRRSGKDVLEKVGDMTRNHLVQQHRAQYNVAEGQSDGPGDVKSGKQGMMTAFFKAKGAAGQKETRRVGRGNQSRVSTAKAQKQSLILLEEADILYEEDKQFWPTLMTMMAQSRRPFVITCNDESLIPLQNLNLHGIFRFGQAPSVPAVDLCLLIAANEGHVLRRSAVESLYHSRDGDLRAIISDLNFWCQIGVGDRKGGFDWFYSRWPKGSDLDERGNIVRVISEDTYRHGMGWLGRDVLATALDPLEKEAEAMHQSWDSWQIDVGDWYESINMHQAAVQSWTVAGSANEKLANWKAYDAFCNTLSDADMCSSGVFATMLQQQIDPSLPDLPNSTRDDFTVGQGLLEADNYYHPTSWSKSIAVSLKSLARETLKVDWEALKQGSERYSVLDAVDERSAVSKLDASFRQCLETTTRLDIAHAFDPIAVSAKAQPTSYLDPSVFDRTMQTIIVDVAPWVRGIVAFEHQLMQERMKLSSLLSEGGSRKRMRNTRSAYSALEGGERGSTRKERYFGNSLTTELVMRTGGEGWQNALPPRLPEAALDYETESSQPSVQSPREVVADIAMQQ